MAVTKPGVAIGMAMSGWESFLRSRKHAILLDKWERGEQYDIERDGEGLGPLGFDPDVDERFVGRPFVPSSFEANEEHEDLARRAPNALAGLLVTTLSQTAYVDGVRRGDSKDNLKAWETWQANGWDRKQTSVHRTAIGMSTAYGVALPGRDPLTGDRRTRMLARSPKRMAAFYDYDDDEWAQFAIEATPRYERSGLSTTPIFAGWNVTLYEESYYHRLEVKGDGRNKEDWTYIQFEDHPLKVTPVARCVNRIDLDGRATGEIEAVLPMLRRIDQDVFDRLIVQRFGAWKVRWVTGMAKPTSKEEARLKALNLHITDLLIAESDKAKFGTLDGTDPKPFLEITDADLRMLSAISQTPPHHLLGLSSNLQAEALAAAESGLQRKSSDFRTNAGEFHEQMFRMTATIDGNAEEARAYDMQVRWRDTESRSLSQAADALGKLAVQLRVPVEMLWEKIPTWTDTDTKRAKKLLESGDSIERILEEFDRATREETGGTGVSGQ